MFFAVLQSFLNEIAFDTKLSGRFSGSKTKLRNLLLQNLVQTDILLISNCAAKIMLLDLTVLGL